MRRHAFHTLCITLAFIACSAALRAQTSNDSANVPVVTIPAAHATSTQKFGGIIGVRDLPGARVLVDDGGARQLKLFDSTLTTGKMVLDSVSEGSNFYGQRRAPVIPYFGDSTLFPDYASVAMLVIDDKGAIVRSMAFPTQSDISRIRQGAGLDAKGRLVFLGEAPTIPSKVQGVAEAKADSVPLLRADFDLRRTDTIGKVLHPLRVTKARAPDGSAVLGLWLLDPLRTIDDWAILADGTVAVVRGHDYHVDWIAANDAHSASGKLPFDWKQLSDADKQRVIDSTRIVMTEAMNDGSIANRLEMLTVTRTPGMRPPSPQPARPATGRASTAFPGFVLDPDDASLLREVHDYYPPLRTGAAIADADNNLWILPTTSKNSRQGELVYDVVNSKGALFRRVRVPLGRLIVGFGKGGVVYMSHGDLANGFVLERSRVPAATPK